LNPKMLTMFIAMWVACPASAATITIRTGVDSLGAALADGAVDSDWLISTNGGVSFNPAVVAFPAQLCCSMDTVPGPAKWITDPSVQSNSEATGWGIDNPVTVATTFDLTGFNLATTSLSGFFRTADNTLNVSINGVVVPSTAQFFSFENNFPISAGAAFFVPGTNTLSMTGTSVNSRWDGFWLDVTVTDGVSDNIPEPSTVSLMLAGVSILAFGSRRLRS